MQNVQKTMINMTLVLGLIAAPLSFADVTHIQNDTQMVKSKSLKTQQPSLAARFNFEHVRFQFVVSDKTTTLKKSVKRKRIAFSNLV